jgi:hypothetical protein
MDRAYEGNETRQLVLELGMVPVDAVVRRLVAQKTLPAKQIVKFSPWMIEREHLDLPAVRRAVRLVHTGRRDPSRMSDHAQTRMFCNPQEPLGET